MQEADTKVLFSEGWFGQYDTTDLLNLFVEAEGRFANSMSRIKIAYLEIDATVLAKFDDKVLAVMRRMKSRGEFIDNQDHLVNSSF